MSSIPNPITPQYLAENHSAHLLATGIPVSIIAIVAVGLRFWCRRRIKVHLWWDDYAIAVALVWLLVVNILIMIDAELWGLGHHIPAVTNTQVVAFLKALLTIQLMYFCTQALIKSSLLFLYYRIFSNKEAYRYAIYGAGVLVFMWWAGLFFAGLFECVPIAAFWDKSIQDPKCFNLIPFSLANGITNMLTDVIVLCLPIPMVLRLHTDKKQKATLVIIFSLGLFVCIISIIRITTLKEYNPIDPTWNVVDIYLWTSVESSIGILSACLPTMKPLLGSFIASRDSDHSKTHSANRRNGGSVTDSSTRPVWPGPDTGKSGFTRLDEELALDEGQVERPGVTSWVTSDVRGGENAYPMGIMQHKAFSQSESRMPSQP